MLEFIEILQHVDLFKGLTSENIEDLLIIDSYYIKEYKKNSVIYFQNEKCITLDIVLKRGCFYRGN